VTSAYEPMTTFDSMRFVKTRSLIYTPFHKEARYINFEVGYSKESKWLEFVNDKWTNYANFFIAGFYEAAYTTYEKDLPVTYVQIEAKVIDYDARFRNQNSSLENLVSSPTSPSTNVFAQKRSKISSARSPSTPKNFSRNDSIIMQEQSNDDIVMIEDTQEDDNPDEEKSDDDDLITSHKSKKKRLSNLCDTDSESDETNEPIKKNKEKGSYGGRGRGGRGGRGGKRK
jgi:hypothetical protein